MTRYATPPEKKIIRLTGIQDIITLFDNDSAGQKGREKIAEVMKGKATIHHLLLPDGVKDPGEIDVQDLASALGQYVKLDSLLLCDTKI